MHLQLKKPNMIHNFLLIPLEEVLLLFLPSLLKYSMVLNHQCFTIFNLLLNFILLKNIRNKTNENYLT